MQNTFEEKRKILLKRLQMLAMSHNRDYYVSIIPIIESATGDQEDIIDMYQLALEEDMGHLLQSREAFVTVKKVNSLI